MSTAETPIDKDALRRIKGMNPPEEATPRTEALRKTFRFIPLSGEAGIAVASYDTFSQILERELSLAITELAQLRRQVAEREAIIALAKRMCDEALPKFNWGNSALDSNAITLLNTAGLAIQRCDSSALAAERAATIERCANIAENFWRNGLEYTGGDIATSIRALGNTDGGTQG